MARSENVDPLSKYRWKITIDGFSRAGFTTCETPSFRISTHNYPEGGAHMSPRQIMNTIEYPPVTFSRGVTTDTSFNRWATGLHDLVENQAGTKISVPNNASPENSNQFVQDIVNTINLVESVNSSLGPKPVKSFAGGGQYRKEVTIKHVNRVGQTIVEYVLHGAWVSEYKPASNFDATDDDGFSIETITLSYDSFDVRYSGIAGSLASLGAGQLF